MVKYIVSVMLFLMFIVELHAEEIKSSTPVKNEVKGPLKTLTKEPGVHIQKIKDMPDNSWLILGQAKADPKWGTARGRGYSPKMAFSTNLNAAFYCGTGRHGARINSPDKSSQHHMDDLWVYDVMGHKWICLYPGANVKTLDLKLNEHGFEVTKDGHSQPVAFLSHAYNQVTYIPETNQYMAIYRYNPWWTKNLPQRAKWLETKKLGPYNAGKLNRSTRHPVFYNSFEGKWERRFIKGQGLGSRGKNLNPAGMGILEYIPNKKKCIYVANGGVLWFDPFNNTWSTPKAPRAKIKYDSTGCYDSKRERIYVAKGGFWYYDINANTWTTIKGKNQMESLRSWPMTFDEKSGMVIYFGANKMNIYNPDTNEWSIGAEQPKANYKYKSAAGFYSAKLNAHFYYRASDSGNKGAFWQVYKFKN